MVELLHVESLHVWSVMLNKLLLPSSFCSSTPHNFFADGAIYRQKVNFEFSQLDNALSFVSIESGRNRMREKASRAKPAASLLNYSRRKTVAASFRRVAGDAHFGYSRRVLFQRWKSRPLGRLTTRPPVRFPFRTLASSTSDRTHATPGASGTGERMRGRERGSQQSALDREIC